MNFKKIKGKSMSNDTEYSKKDNNKIKAQSEINTFDSPMFILGKNEENNLEKNKFYKSNKSFMKSLYTFITLTTLLLTIILASSELSNFIMNDIGAKNMLFKRIFGQNHSNENANNLSDLILMQSFVDMHANKENSSTIESKNQPETINENKKIYESQDKISLDTDKKEESTTKRKSPLIEEPVLTNQFPIIRMDLSALSLGETYIHNSSINKPNVRKLMKYKLDSYYKSEIPLVLVIHTHATESFMPEGAKFYTRDVEIARSTNCDENMIAVGKAFVAALEEEGIMTIHCTTMHDQQSYRESYSRSANSIEKYLKAYPTIKFVFDLHRDSIMRSDNSLVSTITTLDGISYAQIMPVVGSGFNGYEKNLALALQLRMKLNEKYTNICRPVCLRPSNYNQHMATSSLLLEIGSSGNNINEAKKSAKLLAIELADIIKSKNN